jgi:hypothetical protein
MSETSTFVNVAYYFRRQDSVPLQSGQCEGSRDAFHQIGVGMLA